jgi:hypothetical protein
MPNIKAEKKIDIQMEHSQPIINPNVPKNTHTLSLGTLWQ